MNVIELPRHDYPEFRTCQRCGWMWFDTQVCFADGHDMPTGHTVLTCNNCGEPYNGFDLTEQEWSWPTT